MKEVLDFLKACPSFMLATVDGENPKLRPFGFVMEHEGKLYFATSNDKDVYKQLVANPNIQICAVSETGAWIRVTAKTAFDKEMKVKEKVFEVQPDFVKIYKAPDNPIFEIFYITEGEATFYMRGSDPKVVQL